MSLHLARRGISAALCCIAFATFVGASQAATGTASAGMPGTLNIRVLLNPGTLDPAKAADTAAIAAAHYAYDTLVADVNGKIEPELATKWVVTRKSIKMWIRKGVTCSDGSNLTAAVVATNIGRVANPATGSPYATNVFGSLKGVHAHADNKAGTVTVDLGAPYGDLLFGMSQLFIVCRPGLNNPSMLTTKTDGTGPYVLSDFVSGDHYTYVKRKGYTWGPNGATNAGGPNKIVLHVIGNETTATNLLLTGGLDVTMALGPDRSRLEADKSLFKSVVASEIDSVFFNHRAGHPGANQNIRLALASAIRRNNLAAVVGGKFARPANTLLLPQSPCQDPGEAKAIPSYNLAAAKRYFAAAGYTNQGGKLMKNGQQLTLKVLIPDVFGPAADYLLSAWQKLGVKVDAEVHPASQVVGTLLTGGDWDVTIVGNATSTPSVLFSFLAGPTPPKGVNFMYMANHTYNVDASKAKRNPTLKACKLWSTADEAVEKAADLVPFLYSDAAWFSRDVKFVPYSLAGIWPTSFVPLK